MFTKQTAWKNLVSREFIVLWICTTTRGFGGKQSCAVRGIKLWGIHEFWFIWDTWIFLVFSVSIFDEHWYNFVVKIIITSNKTYTKITLARTKCCFKKNVEIDLIWTFIQLSDNWNQNVWKEFLKEFIQKTNELQ